MKAILEFDFDDENRSDRTEFEMMMKANKMALVIWHFARNSRKGIEWSIEGDETVDKYDAVARVYDKFFEILDDYGVSADELD
jgi:hypothetical protein